MITLSMIMLCLNPFVDGYLCHQLDHATTPEAYSRCLTEMSRRGGSRIASFLEQKYVTVVAAEEEKGERGRVADSTVELLTALRRAQGKRDPLAVEVMGPEEAESIFPNLPTVEAALVNRDSQMTRVVFSEGGDYRSGRQARWRFSVRDAKGKVMPVKLPLGIVHGGGIFIRSFLKFEESWSTMLHMRKFIDLPPGDYSVVVEYHDRVRIADRAYTSDLIVCHSESFLLHVQPRVIDLTAADRHAAKEAAAAIPNDERVKILEGRYGKGAYDFIKPESAVGRLLALGWRAVPTLLDVLDDDKLTDQRRAWVFAILFSITTWNDPRDESDLLAAYDSREGGWAVTGGRGRNLYAMGLGGGGTTSMSGGKIERSAQMVFAKKWKIFRDYIVIREKP